MKKINNTDIFIILSKNFIDATNEILSVYENFPMQFTLKENFSILLMRICDGFMLEQFSSAQLLVQHQKFFSFSILCRSTLDIIIQIVWILSLDDIKKEKAIDCFLNFEGIYPIKGKIKYEWQSLIDKNYSSRNAAIAVGIDCEIFNLPISEDLKKLIKNDLGADKKFPELKLTVFDYLSKITHWNPRMLKELVGINKEKHLGYTSEYLRMCVIALPTFISCSVIFAEIFCRHFFVDNDNQLSRLQIIKTNFERSFADLINDLQQESVVFES